jgi:hypothetical protein
MLIVDGSLEGWILLWRNGGAGIPQGLARNNPQGLGNSPSLLVHPSLFLDLVVCILFSYFSAYGIAEVEFYEIDILQQLLPPYIYVYYFNNVTYWVRVGRQI